MILQASEDEDLGRCWFDFRKDGTYLFTSAGPLGSDCERGSYRLDGDILTLDRSTITGLSFPGKRFAIRKSEFRSSDDLYLYPVDAAGNKLNSNFNFRISEDNRK